MVILKQTCDAGLATLGGGPLPEPNIESFLSHAQEGTIYLSENLLIFVSAAVALDYCLKAIEPISLIT